MGRCFYCGKTFHENERICRFCGEERYEIKDDYQEDPIERILTKISELKTPKTTDVKHHKEAKNINKEYNNHNRISYSFFYLACIMLCFLLCLIQGDFYSLMFSLPTSVIMIEYLKKKRSRRNDNES